MGPVKRLLRLTPAEAGLLARAWVALASTRLALWWRRTAEVDAPSRTAPAPPPGPAASGAVPPPEVRAVAWAVTHAARLIPAATCLTQAIAARRLLAARGIASQVRVGVARGGDGRLLAHAWLEHDGATVLGGTDRDYAPLR